MGSIWGKILHNSLSDAKGLADPRNYARAGKEAVTHPVRFGKGVGKSYVDLVEHPVRTFENHPLNTLLQVAPVGKLATLGAEGGAIGAFGVTGSTRAEALAGKLGAVNKATSPTRATKAVAAGTGKALDVAVDAPIRWKALKYNPGEDIPRQPFGGSVPGLQIDRDLIGKLHAELGHPNTTYSGAYPQPEMFGGKPVKGFYGYKHQDAAIFLHPEHIFDGEHAAADLTQSLLHEARHGYQHANWSRTKRFIDSYRKYENRKVEKDANQFMTERASAYKGLATPDPTNPRIPADRMPQGRGIPRGAQLPVDYTSLYTLANDASKGRVHIDPEMYLTHVENLVKSGRMDIDEAIELERTIYGDARYTPPKSPQELYQRAVAKARG